MIRITKLSGKLYGHETDLDAIDTVNEIIEFVECGDPIILVDDLRDLEKFDINPADIIMTTKKE